MTSTRHIETPASYDHDPERGLRSLNPLALVASRLRKAGKGLAFISEEMDLPRQTVSMLLALDVA